MSNETLIARPSQSWILFCYVAFGASVAMMAIGVAMIGETWWMRGFFAMAALLLIQSCFRLAKTLRDAHESGLFHHRLEDARTEKLLREHA